MNPINETLLVRVSEDGMIATGKFLPPANGGAFLTKSEIYRILTMENIKFGIIEHNIDAYLSNRSKSDSIILAQGKPMTQGENAVITYHFNKRNDGKPKVREDGSVDFHQLNTVTKVQAGDLLATLQREVEGIPGMNVRGKILHPAKVRKQILKQGKNLIISEDGLSLRAAVSGHVSFVKGSVYVSDLYEVNEDVGPATGDIIYDGHVKIRGNILTGYAVKATGNVYIEGIVEGAEIKAGGNIILSSGIQGANKAKITCEGNLIAKFVENAWISVGGMIMTEAILHSQVSAEETITVRGKRGLIVGSQITSGKDIIAKVVGSTMGTATSLTIKINDQKLEERQQLKTAANEKQEELMKIQKVLLDFQERLRKGERFTKEQGEKFKLLHQSYVTMDEDYQEMIEQYHLLSEQIETCSNGTIRIEGIMYPGVKITIDSEVTFNRKETKYSLFYREGSDIKLKALA